MRSDVGRRGERGRKWGRRGKIKSEWGIGRWWSERRLERGVAGHSWASCGLEGEFSLNAWQIKQDTGYFSIPGKNPLAHRSGMRGKERFWKEKEGWLMREPAGCNGPVRQACNRSSPAVNLSLPLPLLSPESKMEAGTGSGSSGSWALTAHTFLLHRQVVGLFNKYRIWWRESAKEGGGSQRPSQTVNSRVEQS